MVYWKWKPLVRRIVIFFLDLESCEIQDFLLLHSLTVFPYYTLLYTEIIVGILYANNQFIELRFRKKTTRKTGQTKLYKTYMLRLDNTRRRHGPVFVGQTTVIGLFPFLT
jgi:hypothetical protein